jgi:hypothetical protein
MLVTNLSVVTITSSIDYASGSNVFGTKSTDTQLFTGSVQITGSLKLTGSFDMTGSFSATVKSFVISHPTKAGMTLEHGVVEGPEHSVFVRGRATSPLIPLPDYWAGLVNEDTITVQLTPVGNYQPLFVKLVAIDRVEIFNGVTEDGIDCYYYIMGTRKDIPPLTVEY